MSPNSPSTVRVSPSPPFLAEESLFTSGDIGGASGDSPELDSDPLWKDRHTHNSRNIHDVVYYYTRTMCEGTTQIKSWGLLIHEEQSLNVRNEG